MKSMYYEEREEGSGKEERNKSPSLADDHVATKESACPRFVKNASCVLVGIKTLAAPYTKTRDSGAPGETILMFEVFQESFLIACTAAELLTCLQWNISSSFLFWKVTLVFFSASVGR
jgi:hypothetical protein